MSLSILQRSSPAEAFTLLRSDLGVRAALLSVQLLRWGGNEAVLTSHSQRVQNLISEHEVLEETVSLCLGEEAKLSLSWVPPEHYTEDKGAVTKSSIKKAAGRSLPVFYHDWPVIRAMQLVTSMDFDDPAVFKPQAYHYSCSVLNVGFTESQRKSHKESVLAKNPKHRRPGAGFQESLMAPLVGAKYPYHWTDSEYDFWSSRGAKNRGMLQISQRLNPFVDVKTQSRFLALAQIIRTWGLGVGEAAHPHFQWDTGMGALGIPDFCALPGRHKDLAELPAMFIEVEDKDLRGFHPHQLRLGALALAILNIPLLVVRTAKVGTKVESYWGWKVLMPALFDALMPDQGNTPLEMKITNPFHDLVPHSPSELSFRVEKCSDTQCCSVLD